MVCILIQVSGFIIHGKTFKKLFLLFGAVLIVNTMFSFPVIKFDSVDVFSNENTDIQVQSNNIKISFEEKVSQKIKNSIYDVHCNDRCHCCAAHARRYEFL